MGSPALGLGASVPFPISHVQFLGYRGIASAKSLMGPGRVFYHPDISVVDSGIHGRYVPCATNHGQQRGGVG